jgi:hypothetical protein
VLGQLTQHRHNHQQQRVLQGLFFSPKVVNRK